MSSEVMSFDPPLIWEVSVTFPGNLPKMFAASQRFLDPLAGFVVLLIVFSIVLVVRLFSHDIMLAVATGT